MTPERLKQLVIETIWFGFLVTIIWIVLRVVGLSKTSPAREDDDEKGTSIVGAG